MADLTADAALAEDALIRIGGRSADGSQGFHFVGDEGHPDECPGCWAWWGLFATVRPTQEQLDALASRGSAEDTPAAKAEALLFEAKRFIDGHRVDHRLIRYVEDALDALNRASRGADESWREQIIGPGLAAERLAAAAALEQVIGEFPLRGSAEPTEDTLAEALKWIKARADRQIGDGHVMVIDAIEIANKARNALASRGVSTEETP